RNGNRGGGGNVEGSRVGGSRRGRHGVEGCNEGRVRDDYRRDVRPEDRRRRERPDGRRYADSRYSRRDDSRETQRRAGSQSDEGAGGGGGGGGGDGDTSRRPGDPSSRTRDSGDDYGSQRPGGRDAFGRDTRNATDGATSRGEESGNLHPSPSRRDSRDGSRGREGTRHRNYSRSRYSTDRGRDESQGRGGNGSHRGVTGGDSRNWNWPRDHSGHRAGDSTGRRDRAGARKGDSRERAEEERRYHGDRGDRRSEDHRSRDNHGDRYGYDYRSGRREGDRRAPGGHNADRGARSWGGGGGERRKDEPTHRSDFTSGGNKRGERDSRERSGRGTKNTNQRPRGTAATEKRDDSSSSTSSAAGAFRDGEWVGGGVLGGSGKGVSNDRGDGKDENADLSKHCNWRGATAASGASSLSATAVMGFVSSRSPVAATTKPAAAAVAASGDAPRRPRWDKKAAPGVTVPRSATGGSSTKPDAAVPGKKLVWGGGATGAAGEGIGKKRALWGAVAGDKVAAGTGAPHKHSAASGGETP
ncbi:unnamed protein product, partial [Sphacelaria rigidula]